MSVICVDYWYGANIWQLEKRILVISGSKAQIKVHCNYTKEMIDMFECNLPCGISTCLTVCEKWSEF